MEIRILASGSKGNVISLISNGNHLLIDIGISFTKVKKKFEEYKLDLKSIDGIVLTHEHKDHSSGLRVFLSNHFDTKVYLTKGTMDGLDKDTKSSLENYIFIEPEVSFQIKSFKIYPILTSHDANEPIGLVITANDKKAVFITDTGYIHKDYFEVIQDADFYYLEANHDELMLMQTHKRPHHLKMRILSERGHLSNNEATKILNEVIINKRPIWAVAHISEDCNTYEKIEMAVVKNFDDPFKAKLVYTSQESSEVIKI
ncbi:MAG: MBL fold metallo-hydrolase [Acholeplasmataceae bacterium]|jgi:phosphoribosyl 1,2-cyclic phosphodiesterase